MVIPLQEKESMVITNTILILKQVWQNFRVLEKFRILSQSLFINISTKPASLPRKSVPCHLKVRVLDAIYYMWLESLTEQYPINEPSLWVPCPAIVPKSNGSICITLDTLNVNKTIISTNQPLRKQDDTRFQLVKTKYFCRLDFKLVFWQPE